jgi:3-dehydroquinate synthase
MNQPQHHTIPVSVSGSDRTYSIEIGAGTIGRLRDVIDFERYSSVALLTDENIPERFVGLIDGAVDNEYLEMLIKPGEITKDMETVEYVWQTLLENGFDRKSLLINLGGGVIGDLGGFAAATYMRGIDFVQIPTTLLSMVDASIGGKTGVNFGGVKNSIGAFAQPIAVIVDTDTLDSLPDREFTSGFSEIIKHGIIADRTYFDQATAKPPREFMDNELSRLIADSCRIKAAIVASDERELTGRREALNFGHTIGHAIEALKLETKNPMLHGEAIAVGMVAEARIALAMGELGKDDATRIENALSAAGLPITVTGLDPKDIMEKMRSDKKNTFGKIRWTLPTGIGQVVTGAESEDVTISEAIESVLA